MRIVLVAVVAEEIHVFTFTVLAAINPTTHKVQREAKGGLKVKTGDRRFSSDDMSTMWTKHPAITYRYLCEAGSKPWPE